MGGEAIRSLMASGVQCARRGRSEDHRKRQACQKQGQGAPVAFQEGGWFVVLIIHDASSNLLSGRANAASNCSFRLEQVRNRLSPEFPGNAVPQGKRPVSGAA